MIVTCSPQVTQQAITLVVAFMSGVFINKDITAVDRYISNAFINHNPLGDTKADLFNFFRAIVKQVEYTPGGVVGNCDIVMVYGRYANIGPKPLIGVDIFRMDNGQIAEDWDILQDEVPANQTVSKNQMFTRL